MEGEHWLDAPSGDGVHKNVNREYRKLPRRNWLSRCRKHHSPSCRPTAHWSKGKHCAVSEDVSVELQNVGIGCCASSKPGRSMLLSLHAANPCFGPFTSEIFD